MLSVPVVGRSPTKNHLRIPQADAPGASYSLKLRKCPAGHNDRIAFADAFEKHFQLGSPVPARSGLLLLEDLETSRGCERRLLDTQILIGCASSSALRRKFRLGTVSN